MFEGEIKEVEMSKKYLNASGVFAILLFFSSSLNASPVKLGLKNLLKRSPKKIVDQTVDEKLLEKLKATMGSKFKVSSLDEKTLNLLREAVENPEIKFTDMTLSFGRYLNANWPRYKLKLEELKPTMYSVAIKNMYSEVSQKEPFDLLVQDMRDHLKLNRDAFISSPHFKMPSPEIDENGYREEVFTYIRDRLTNTKNVAYHESSEVLLKWWDSRDFRNIVFDSITKNHLKDSKLVLKWWDEAKAVGVNSRLGEYISSSFGNLGEFSDGDEIWRIIDGNPFLKAVFNAVKEVSEDSDFFKEVNKSWETIGRVLSP